MAKRAVKGRRPLDIAADCLAARDFGHWVIEGLASVRPGGEGCVGLWKPINGQGLTEAP